ncbi:flavin reductase family protein [Streptomyces sp. NPDC002888]|uniref:flavin reductase family protein n=1 Tax=Streptomyces sp. NPDC002888 TaxID=3364668 RepID=UPI0036908AA4
MLVTTQHRGTPNVMTNGFNMMVRHPRPLVACTMGPWDHNHQALVETGEGVISIPTADMAATVVDIGNCSGADVDKFAEFDLTAVAGAEVQAPLVAGCFANIECKVADSSLVAPYNLFLREPVRAWTDRSQTQPQLFHHRGDGTFTLDGPTIDLKERMTKWQYLL